ncbi:MAG: phytanoyl-CoA dioxygenase family protein, partial [Alphaproteobacteria bacterium]|nr:phytanoyl-CoA dioxygenase family protein [Alphaproteobacteria bacterium]
AVPWHQDGPFWPVAPLASCTVWIALDRVDEGNGAMRMIPGSHRQDYKKHDYVEDPNSTLNHEINLDLIDDSVATVVALEPGQVSLHDIGIIHGSAANSSARRRAGLALRYMPSTSNMFRQQENGAANWTTMPMELVRGENRHPGNDFAPGEFGRPWAGA